MASSIITSIVTGGVNNHATVSEEANAYATDFITQGIVGAIGNTIGIAPCTGGFGISQSTSPAMTVDVNIGRAYVSGTPSGQSSQVLRARMSATYTGYIINSNASGSTKYDWIYLKLDPTTSANPGAAADDVISLYTSRSTSNASDNGTPPTYGIPLAVITVTNGASSIVNGNITDKRTNTTITPGNISVSGLVNTGDLQLRSISLETIKGDTQPNCVVSGCIWTGDAYASTRVASMTSGVVYINGKRLTVSAVVSRTFTASKDVYVDLLDNGDNTAIPVYTDATTNAASPSLAANSIRLAIVVVGASNIASVASINQGQIAKVLPIASNISYTVSDSLGNLICPRPGQNILAHRTQKGGAQGSITTMVDLTGQSAIVTVPEGRTVRITAGNALVSTVALDRGSLDIYEDGGSIYQSIQKCPGTDSLMITAEVYSTPSAGTHTYKVRASRISGTGTLTYGASPSFMAVELV